MVISKVLLPLLRMHANITLIATHSFSWTECIEHLLCTKPALGTEDTW